MTVSKSHTIPAPEVLPPEHAEWPSTKALARKAELLAREIDSHAEMFVDIAGPFWGLVDLTAAAGHLRTAARLLSRAESPRYDASELAQALVATLAKAETEVSE